MALNFKRKQLYVNAEVQFKYSVMLVVIATIESMIFGILISNVLSSFIAKRSGENFIFTAVVLFFILLILVVVNIYLGAYVTHKLAGPIYAFQQKLKQLTLGDFTRYVELRKGDDLGDFETDFNNMIRSIKEAVHKDRETAGQVKEFLKDLRKDIEKLALKDKAKYSKTITEMSKKLDEISAFYRL
jgi:methyl-accepting chemotaxis protein